MPQDSPCKFLVLADEGDDCLAIVLRDVFGLADLGTVSFSGILLFGVIGLRGVFFIIFSLFMRGWLAAGGLRGHSFEPIIIKLGGIFSRGCGVILTVLFTLRGVSCGGRDWDEAFSNKGVVFKQFLVEEVGDFQEL